MNIFLFLEDFHEGGFPANIYSSNDNNKNTINRCEICKVNKKDTEKKSGDFTHYVHPKEISHIMYVHS